MQEKTFNYKIADAQGTYVAPIAPEQFDIEGYCAYEADLLDKCRIFWEKKNGVAVYRRFRVPEVFSYGSKDLKTSLALQLAALQESMKYKADIPNFLEPWYGIGTVVSAFGLNYEWHDNQAPATRTPFKSIEEVLQAEQKPVEETEIGRHTLEMIEYFLDKTKGKIPMSFTDTQSPLNIASALVDINSFFLEIYDNPEGVKELFGIITKLLIDFTKKQHTYIGDALASPGHGFSSSRAFQGLGMSDDIMLMLSDAIYEEFALPYAEQVGANFGGTAFHSCGNWTRKIPVVKNYKNLVMADGAFSQETDPDANLPDLFSEAYKGTGAVLNARIVGNAERVAEQVKKLWRPDMKLIVATYCDTPEEQEKAYERIHEICR
ncbi:uroporphyrinogen decarboxylase family protein [Geosporobacter ferrireducens]|uniref:Uroporphyrinogen decarboxylase (URO-D) domain-containing protein n=1 Tax=Geosporobacter ferrireducens TaxID=1424294 RepID=A0A1D8GK32_9FIRM|nr:uroporphyrinogen decarboxylase family protein [Geosporobacter ferrireducens]AOT71266.1 hypothetical protein Gferi_17920 [Geosporobacter ferrireducens]